MTRRDFHARMVVLGAGTLVSAVPFSTTVLADAVKQWGAVPPIDTGFDEALQNYPGYSAVIPVSSAHQLVASHLTGIDAQLLV